MSMPALANFIIYYYLIGGKTKKRANPYTVYVIIGDCELKEIPHFIVFPKANTKCIYVYVYAVK